ncbi:MAG: Thymidylate kinase [Alyxoria varia]|nr:MAG: Thymidylate kinase [Alyxoria varia]
MIDEYLKGNLQQEDHAIHLLFSANRWEAVPKIEEALAAGKEVVIDRYYYSGCVYSAAKNNPSLSLEWARKSDEGLPRPDVCVFLTVSPDEAAKRGGFGRERYENSEMQDRVRSLFDVLRHSAEKDDFAIVDGGKSPDEVEDAVRTVVEVALNDTADNSKHLTRVEPW